MVGHITLRHEPPDLRWRNKHSGATVNYGSHRNLRWTLNKNIFLISFVFRTRLDTY
ncbi:hypothetical protein HanHA300_Chr16g0604261 [Helianthus annuus]|nr:hypothetical protein HanHA300_Chr16g0604261 [Helianthus annuus]KAJ0459870.1 hypothetical protein HanHA89_Chr16g0653961 [Helianthus annuus]